MFKQKYIYGKIHPMIRRVCINNLLENTELFNKFCADMQNGGVAIVPTDTLYGFAVAANNDEAVKRVYSIKNRDAHKPLILFLSHFEELNEQGFNLSGNISDIIKQHWPGALTVILNTVISDSIKAFHFSTIGIRIPAHNDLLKLIDKLPFRFLTTSANRSGSESDCDPDNIEKEFKNEADWLLDGGILSKSLPSTIVDFSVTPYKILRQGKVIL